MAYVYRHIRLDKNEPFYIGISSTKYRPHELNPKRRNIIWERIVAKTDCDVEILFENVSWEFAIEKEKEFIKLYGRLNIGTGTLANLTDGGDGTLGVVFNDITRKKMSEKRRGVKLSEETKIKIGQAHRGKIVSAESRRKISQAGKGKIANNKGKKMPRHQYDKLIIDVEKRKIKVAKYGLDGKFIELYNSVIGAAKENNLIQGNITNACMKCIMYGNFQWRYIGEHDSLEDISPYDIRIKKVFQRNSDDLIISEYSSVMDAARKNGWVKSTILRALKRKNNIAYGYKWTF